MKDASHELHERIVHRLAARYRSKGFEVAVDPRDQDKPEFLGAYDPDLVARGPDKSVIVEVKVGTLTAYGERFRDIAELVAAQPGWEFSLVISGMDDLDEEIPFQTLPTNAEIQVRLSRSLTLLNQGSLDASLLLLWSSLEAVLRMTAEHAGLPLRNEPTSALIRELYSAGELSRDQYEQALRQLPARNSLVHGFAVVPTREQVEALDSLAKALLHELEQSPAWPSPPARSDDAASGEPLPA
ncbi:MAG: hypothetical protein AB1646_25090 [Thermodesulfobacteriota bacterium]